VIRRAEVEDAAAIQAIYVEERNEEASIADRGHDLGRRLLDEFCKVGAERWVAAEMSVSPTDPHMDRFATHAGFTRKDKAIWCVKYLEEL
jgi:hypothetical protein